MCMSRSEWIQFFVNEVGRGRETAENALKQFTDYYGPGDDEDLRAALDAHGLLPVAAEQEPAPDVDPDDDDVDDGDLDDDDDEDDVPADDVMTQIASDQLSRTAV